MERRTSMTSLPPREAAWALLCEYTVSDSLRKHALGVEAVMRAYANRYGGDAERWGMVGLLHDFDYERYPSMEDHPLKGSEILQELGYPDDIRYAILCASICAITRSFAIASRVCDMDYSLGVGG